MLRIVIGLAIVAVVALGLALVLVLRSPVRADSVVSPGVEIVCAGSTGVTSSACGDWGDEILSAATPSTTFELEDVVRIEIDRPTFGFSSSCTVSYFLGRYPDEVAWDEEIACAERSDLG